MYGSIAGGVSAAAAGLIARGDGSIEALAVGSIGAAAVEAPGSIAGRPAMQPVRTWCSAHFRAGLLTIKFPQPVDLATLSVSGVIAEVGFF